MLHAKIIDLKKEKIEVKKAEEFISSSKFGASLIFKGTVRETNENKKVTGITYDSHDAMVIKSFEKIYNEVDNSLEVFCVVSTVAKTGVEMEAIMGVNAALITIYDLSKIVNPHLKIDNIRLLIKEGGKSGLWKNPDGVPKFLENIF